jgi:hypothetical protein
MSRATQENLEPLVPHITQNNQNPFDKNARHPSSPVVLETVDIGQQFGERAVSTICPGCGGILTRYRDGLPLRLARYEEECERCTTTLQRWAVLAVGSAYEQLSDPSVLRETVTQYWNTNLWSGIVTGETSPRTMEYSQLYAEQADEFGWDWNVTCPLCRTTVSELDVDRLDYHHWRREPDRGVCLCRTCHDAVSGQQTDETLDWQAQELGLKNKYDLQITRLALREQAISDRGSLQALVERINSRYNLFQTPAHIYSLLSQTLSDQTVLDAVSDGYLLAEISS